MLRLLDIGRSLLGGPHCFRHCLIYSTARRHSRRNITGSPTYCQPNDHFYHFYWTFDRIPAVCDGYPDQHPLVRQPYYQLSSRFSRHPRETMAPGIYGFCNCLTTRSFTHSPVSPRGPAGLGCLRHRINAPCSSPNIFVALLHRALFLYRRHSS